MHGSSRQQPHQAHVLGNSNHIAQSASPSRSPGSAAAAMAACRPSVASSTTTTSKQPRPAPAAAAAGQAQHGGAPGQFHMLEMFLSKQKMVEEPLLPTPANVNTIHLPHDELLSFVSVQHWLQQHLGGAPVQLLGGSFVLVQSADLPSPANAQDVQAAASIPWRLRQVAAVELGPPGSDPAGSTVVLVGGDRVSAGSVGGPLESAPDYQYLCCELAALQEVRLMPPLKVYDVAHVAYRTRVSAQLQELIEAYTQEQAELVAAGYDTEMLQQAGQVTMDSASSMLRKMPPLDWVSGQIMQYIELNPYAWPESPEQPWQLLSAGQYSQLIQAAAAAWGQYVACTAARQRPQPVLDLVPWAPLPDSEAVEPAAAQDAAPVAPASQQQHVPQAGMHMPHNSNLQQQQQQQQQTMIQQQQQPVHDMEAELLADDYGFYDDPFSSPTGGQSHANSLQQPQAAPAHWQTGTAGASGDETAAQQGSRVPAASTDYSFWVQRGDAEAAAADPKRATALRRNAQSLTAAAAAAASRGQQHASGDQHPSAHRPEPQVQQQRQPPHRLSPVRGDNTRPELSSYAREQDLGRTADDTQQQAAGRRGAARSSSSNRAGRAARSHSKAQRRSRSRSSPNSSRRQRSHRSPSRDYSHRSRSLHGAAAAAGSSRQHSHAERSPVNRRRSRTRSRSRSRGRARDSHMYSMARGRGRSRSPPGSRIGRAADWLRSRSRSPVLSIENEVQQYLQQLAAAMGPDCCILRGRITHSFPIPHRVFRHYGSVAQFVSQRPELEWGKQEGHYDRWELRLLPQHYARLVASGLGRRASSGPQPQQQQQHGRVTSEPQPQQPQPPQAAAAPREYHGSVQQQTQQWLEGLAQLLGPAPRPGSGQPPKSIEVTRLRPLLPLPPAVRQAYRHSFPAFVDACPAVGKVGGQWLGGTRWLLFLEPSHHAALLAAAAAAQQPARQADAQAAAAGDAGHSSQRGPAPAAPSTSRGRGKSRPELRSRSNDGAASGSTTTTSRTRSRSNSKSSGSSRQRRRRNRGRATCRDSSKGRRHMSRSRSPSRSRSRERSAAIRGGGRSPQRGMHNSQSKRQASRRDSSRDSGRQGGQQHKKQRRLSPEAAPEQSGADLPAGSEQLGGAAVMRELLGCYRHSSSSSSAATSEAAGGGSSAQGGNSRQQGATACESVSSGQALLACLLEDDSGDSKEAPDATLLQRPSTPAQHKPGHAASAVPLTPCSKQADARTAADSAAGRPGCSTGRPSTLEIPAASPAAMVKRSPVARLLLACGALNASQLRGAGAGAGGVACAGARAGGSSAAQDSGSKQKTSEQQGRAWESGSKARRRAARLVAVIDSAERRAQYKPEAGDKDAITSERAADDAVAAAAADVGSSRSALQAPSSDPPALPAHNGPGRLSAALAARLGSPAPPAAPASVKAVAASGSGACDGGAGAGGSVQQQLPPRLSGRLYLMQPPQPQPLPLPPRPSPVTTPPPPPPPPPRRPSALSQFASNLHAALDQRPPYAAAAGLSLPVAAGLLPASLAELLRCQWQDFTIDKLIADHLPAFAVGVVARRAELGGGQLQVVQRLARPRPLAAPACMFWRAEVGGGCRRGAACSYRHGLPAKL